MTIIYNNIVPVTTNQNKYNNMKCKIFIVVSIVMLSLLSCSKENGLSANFIKGNATSFTDTIWNVSEKFGDVVKDDIDKVVKMDFDENGNIINITTYNSSGELVEKTIQKWNGNNIEEIFNYDEDGKQQFHWKYYWKNDKVQKIVTTCTMSSKWVETTTYYYSQNNPERFDSIIVIKDSERDLYTYKYLDDNNSHHEYIKFSTGNKSDAIYYFDKDKRLIKEKHSYGTKTYAYNDKGLLVKSAWDDGIIKEYIYEFDTKGSLIKRITYVTNEIKKATEMLTRHIEYK